MHLVLLLLVISKYEVLQFKHIKLEVLKLVGSYVEQPVIANMHLSFAFDSK